MEAEKIKKIRPTLTLVNTTIAVVALGLRWTYFFQKMTHKVELCAIWLPADKNATEKTESYGHNNPEKCEKYILIISEKCVILFSDV